MTIAEFTIGDAMKLTIDIAAATTTIAVLTAILPPIAAALTIIWTALRIYEMDTIQKWLNKGKN